MEPAEISAPPGDFLKTELEKRGWSQLDLASILNRPVAAINEVIKGKRAITPEMAIALAAAFGIPAEEWMARESAFRLSLVRSQDSDTGRKAKLYEIAPVKEMEKRGWIPFTDTLAETEAAVCRFFGVSDLNDIVAPRAFARQTQRALEFTGAQTAWLRRALQFAEILNVRSFDHSRFVAALPEIRQAASSLESIGAVPRLLAELGVRLVIVEALPKSRIDGAMFWLEKSEPVIVLTLRYDRIDWFWHTLAHELFHIVNNDHESIDSNLVGETKNQFLDEMEDRADRQGSAWLIDNEKLESFIIRTKPFYSKVKIVQFAKRLGVHPGIVNGQLQHRREVGWHANREMLVKVKDILTTVALTDGWGKTVKLKSDEL
ncbi:MAG TPA: helix-turn-helix domain-containing protein [Chthoniobacterales bacterium]|jgi:HTH-type transcriptional regulator/antitoxin HigA